MKMETLKHFVLPIKKSKYTMEILELTVPFGLKTHII